MEKSKSMARWQRVTETIGRNLFSGPLDGLLTVGALILLVYAVPPLLDWFFFEATFAGTTRGDCIGDGACWVSVLVRLPYYLYGDYPVSERWRIHLFLFLWLAGAGAAYWRLTKKSLLLIGGLILLPLLSFGLLYGIPPILPVVETERWGGLFLTLIIAGVGIGCSLPLGVLLALARRSHLPMVRVLAVSFIEFWRGVPLITVLFMTSFMFPLFLPEGVTFDKLLRCLVGVTLFSSAYMAEVVRGGLQALPKGQYEAALALGLNYRKMMMLVILPQALKKVIPGIVNTFIGLFKDTTLVSTVAMFDLLGTVQKSSTDPDWLGYSTEGYFFAGAVFWFFCFTMSRYSKNLEKKLSTEARG